MTRPDLGRCGPRSVRRLVTLAPTPRSMGALMLVGLVFALLAAAVVVALCRVVGWP